MGILLLGCGEGIRNPTAAETTYGGPVEGSDAVLAPAVAAEDRDALWLGCGALTLATLWRWAWLARLQRYVQASLRGRPPRRLRGRLVPIVLTRLSAAVALTWGSFLILPAYWGFFLAGFAGPALLDEEGTAGQAIRRSLRWITMGVGPLMRAAVILSLLMVVLTINVVVAQRMLVNMVLPALTGLPPTEAALTMSGIGWGLVLGFGLFCIFDVYWHVDLQQRLASVEQHASGRATPERDAMAA